MSDYQPNHRVQPIGYGDSLFAQKSIHQALIGISPAPCLQATQTAPGIGVGALGGHTYSSEPGGTCSFRDRGLVGKVLLCGQWAT